MRPPHKVKVSVGDRNSLLINTRPRFDICFGGLEGFAILVQSVRGLQVYHNKTVPILSVNSTMDVSFAGMDS